MNFNVHRRNKSFAASQHPPDRKQMRSLKKVQHIALTDNLLNEAKDIYHSHGNLMEAVQLFQQYLALNPRSNEALYLCGVCELKLGRIQSAIQRLGQVSSQYPNKPNAMLLAAMALNKIGKLTQSLQAVNQCIHRFDGFQEAICFRGKLYLSLKYYHRAEQDFKALAAQSKASFLTHHSLGDCYRAQGRPEKAIGPYLKALQMLQEQEGGPELERQMELKVGISLYQLERWNESYKFLQSALKNGQKSCDLYYYLGGSEMKLGKRQEALLHFQYCLKVQGNPAIMRKAYKKLIELYLSDYQFYEALNIVKIGDISSIHVDGWANAVESFMAIIKGRYREGVAILTGICADLKKSEQSKKIMRFKREASNPKARYNNTSEIAKSLHSGIILVKQKQKSQKEGRLGHFSTKSVLRAVPKIESTRLKTKMLSSNKKEQVLLRTDHMDVDRDVEFYSGRQKEFIFPLILLFKAYGQFFENQYFTCLDTYEEYEAYIKDVYGRDSDVLYNKSLCQALLMAENDMHEEAINKYNYCVEIYHEKHGQIPIEPLLYKVCLLAKLAVENNREEDEEKTSPNREILESILQFMDNYKQAIGSNSLAFYFRSMVLLLLGRLTESCEWLQKGLKVAEDCSWRWLWVKGVIETKLGNYYDAVKQFSAGLILENRPELYLGRSIAFFLLSESKGGTLKTSKEVASSVSVRKSDQDSEIQTKQVLLKEKNSSCDILIENSFEDLQKYIQLENKQEEISLWVSKVLFANGAFEEAIRSLQKISNQTEEVTAMLQAVSIYEGQFDRGGNIGKQIKAAFQGLYMTQEEEKALFSEKSIKGQGSFSGDYEQWLVILHLYAQKNYALLLKYLQRLLFGCQIIEMQALLRFDVAIVYLLLDEQAKAINALRALVGKQDPFSLKEVLLKLQAVSFDEDQCLQDLKEAIGINQSKLLSNYLPYQSVTIKNQFKCVRIYLRPSIPFPNFPRPSLYLPITTQFIINQINYSSVEKRLEAPWIRRTEKRTVQFTQKLEESGMEAYGETESLKDSKALSDHIFE